MIISDKNSIIFSYDIVEFDNSVGYVSNSKNIKFVFPSQTMLEAHSKNIEKVFRILKNNPMDKINFSIMNLLRACKILCSVKIIYMDNIE